MRKITCEVETRSLRKLHSSPSWGGFRCCCSSSWLLLRFCFWTGMGDGRENLHPSQRVSFRSQCVSFRLQDPCCVCLGSFSLLSCVRLTPVIFIWSLQPVKKTHKLQHAACEAFAAYILPTLDCHYARAATQWRKQTDGRSHRKSCAAS